MVPVVSSHTNWCPYLRPRIAQGHIHLGEAKIITRRQPHGARQPFDTPLQCTNADRLLPAARVAASPPAALLSTLLFALPFVNLPSNRRFATAATAAFAASPAAATAAFAFTRTSSGGAPFVASAPVKMSV